MRPAFQAWWRLIRGTTLGVRVIARRQDGHVVLVKHTYIAGWHLPGGGVDSGETAPEAAARELAEECGLKPTGLPHLLAVFANHRIFRGDHVLLFEVTAWEPCPTCNEGEIEAIGWFDPSDPPEDASPATRRRLAEYRDSKGFALHWS